MSAAAAADRRRVVVTGGTGLLGRYLLYELCADGRFAVVATRRAGSDVSGLGDLPNLTWSSGDLEDADFATALLTDARAVVHCAGVVSYAKRDRGAMRRVNVGLTALLANTALDLGVEHFLHVSSVGAISPAQYDKPLAELPFAFHDHDDTSAYARSKYAGELEVWRAGEEGLPFTILNPSVVLGVGDWGRSSAALIDWVARGQTYYPPGGTGYVDARDVAAFAKTCLLRGAANRRYVVSAENWSFRAFFAEVARVLGVEPPTTLAQAWQAELAWRGAGLSAKLRGRDPVLTRETARKSMRVVRYDHRESVAAGAVYRDLRDTIWDVARAYGAAVWLH